MRGPSAGRRRTAAVLAVVALAGLVGLWWTAPAQLTVNVEVPPGVQSDSLGVVLARRETNGLYAIQATHELRFSDNEAHSTSFSARLPRGRYRLVVSCDNTDRVDEGVRVFIGQTINVTLRQHDGNDGRIIHLE
jgi:hypothetical protein